MALHWLQKRMREVLAESKVSLLRFGFPSFGRRIGKSLQVKNLSKVTGAAIESVKINAIRPELRGNRLKWVKRRRLGSSLLALGANAFFFLVGARIHLWIRLKKWQSWEVACFRLLYGRAHLAVPEGRRTVCVDEIPGKSLDDYADQGILTTREIEAAGRELSRAHGLWCEELHGYWSHGDPHLDNIIYDSRTDRARLIDFEVIHSKSLSALERHADDLFVFLQHLMGLTTREQWIPFALAFISAYDRPMVTEKLRERLNMTNNWGAAIWWNLRTDYLLRTEIIERVGALNRALKPRRCLCA